MSIRHTDPGSWGSRGSAASAGNTGSTSKGFVMDEANQRSPAPVRVLIVVHGRQGHAARTAQRLHGVTPAAADPMPTPEVREMRADSEKGTRTDHRLHHPADPAVVAA